MSYVLQFVLAPRFQDIEPFLFLMCLIAGIIGLGILIATVSSAVQDRLQRRLLTHRVYALTDRRAIIWCPQPRSAGVRVHTLSRGSIKIEHVHRMQYPDESGDVIVRRKYEDPNGFIGVNNVRRVEELVRRFLVESDSQTS